MIVARRSIRTSLFLANAAIITLTTAALVTYISIWGAARLRADMIARIDDKAVSVRTSLDDRLRKMDSVSISVLYSNLVKDRFVAYSAASAPSAAHQAAVGARDDALIDVIFAIIGPTMPARQINIYDFKGRGFGAGMDNRSRSIDPSTPWFAAAAKAGGPMILSSPHNDPYLNRYGSRSDTVNELFISLGRIFVNRYGTPIGVVEIEQSYEELFRDIGRQGGEANGDPETLVFDAAGRLLFPSAGADSALPHVSATASGRSAAEGASRLARFAVSDFSGWKVEVVADERILLAPLRRFVAVSVVLALGLLSVSLVLSFAVARRITFPISRLHGEIVSLRLRGLEAEAEPELGRGARRIGPYEVDELYEAFRDLRSGLKRSMDQAIEAQGAETQARMLALQSQMDPHFIYNTIATIGALAEEGQGQKASDLCDHLSDLLRYVSSQRGTDASGEAELGFTSKYLACIGVRYGDRLSYSLESDPPFAALSMPRLLIQPLVENSVKYATGGEPPWVIRVAATTAGESWTVVVEDGGPGFSPESRERIEALIGRPPRGAGAGQGLGLDGMGLANIAARLRLRYGEDALFEYGDREGGGAFVRIGGRAAKVASGAR